MEIVIITFATADSMYRFTYLRGHVMGQLEGITGAHAGRKFTVQVEEIRDLVQTGESPELRVVGHSVDEIKVDQITEVAKREFYLRTKLPADICISEVPA